MKDEIQQWLDSDRDYLTGVVLYTRYGSNKHLKIQMAKKHSRLLEEKLVYELEKIHLSAPKIKSKKTRVKEKVKTAKAVPGAKEFPKRFSTLKVDPQYNLVDLPDILKKEHFERIALYKEANRIHQQLVHGHLKENQIKSSISTILENMERVDQLWARIDYFKSHGVVPPDPAPNQPTSHSPIEWSDRLKNQVRPGISKLKKKIAMKPTSTRIHDWQNQLARLELEKEDLEEKLRES